MAGDIEILVVDDDLPAAESFAELIHQKLGFVTAAYSDLNKVLDVVRTGTIKVVVLDERMPEMNGTELYTKIKSINPSIKALLLTGEAGVDEIIKANRLGYVDCLQKSKIAELPSKVVLAYTQYEIGVSERGHNEVKLDIWNPFKNKLGIYQYSVCSVELVAKEFIFEDKWQTKLELDSSEQVMEISSEYTKDCIIKAGTEFQKSTNLGFQTGKLASLRSQLDDVVTSRIESTLSFTLKQNKKMTQTYKLQDGKEEGKQVVKKVFERNPVYFKFNVLLKKYCRLCKNAKMLPIEVYKRIPKVATRMTIYYADGTNRLINTGIVTIN